VASAAARSETAFRLAVIGIQLPLKLSHLSNHRTNTHLHGERGVLLEQTVVLLLQEFELEMNIYTLFLHVSYLFIEIFDGIALILVLLIELSQLDLQFAYFYAMVNSHTSLQITDFATLVSPKHIKLFAEFLQCRSLRVEFKV
jgi:hypothetical protein